MENPRDRLLRYIQDAHAAEVGGIAILKDTVATVNSPQAKAILSEHLTETESQARRLEARLAALGGDTSSGKNLLNTLMGKVSDLMNIGHDSYDKTTQDLIKAYATEHGEVGMYTSLEAYATAFGDTETASLARQIIAEEQAAAQRIFPLIAQHAALTLQAAATDNAATV